MNRRKMTGTCVSVVVLLGCLTLAPAPAVFAEGQVCQVVRVTMQKGSAGSYLQVDPQIAKGPEGTCIIWVNWVPEMQIRINFKESAKACMRATDAPSGFKEVENCYLSEYIPLGKTVSLHFKQAGTFKYQVEVPDTTKFTPGGVFPGKIQGSGEIIVE